MVAVITPVWTDKLQAIVKTSRPLLYRDGAMVEADVPAHVRAGSAVVVSGKSMLVFQDDTNVIAQLDRATGVITPCLLPVGPHGERQFGEARNNKKHKLDLEACVTLSDQRIVAFGSGSSAQRERVVVVEVRDTQLSARVCSLSTLYELFRSEKSFSGSELNIEGVARVGSALRFFQRGNGAATASVPALDASVDVSEAALIALIDGHSAQLSLSNVTQYHLGSIASVRATFTDAWSDGDAPVWFLASAEDSPDTYRDGVVTGSAIGCIFADNSAEITLLRHADGAPFCDKAEGLAMDPADANRAFVVVDKDDPEQPSELFEIALTRLTS